MPKLKLVYVLPEYDKKTATHFAHLYGFVEEISKIFDVFLVIEKGSAPANFEGRIYAQKFRWPVCRFLENFLIFKILRFRGYKNFYIHYSFLSAFNASLITKILGGKTFYWNCGLPWNYKRNFAREIFEKAVYRLTSFLVTGTESLKKEYALHYNIPLNKIKVMPNWIDISNFKFEISNLKINEIKKNLNILKNSPNFAYAEFGEQKVIFFAHRLSRRKGAHYLPEILEKLKDENIVLLVAGDGPEKENVILEIEKRGLSGNVRFLGAVPNEELYKYYALADVFIMPSEEEGFPRVLLEAMAVEVPFVVFNVGGVKEIIPPEFLEFVAEIGDIENFILKIKKLLHLPQSEIVKLKTIQQNWVKKYDIKKVIDIFKNLIYNK